MVLSTNVFIFLLLLVSVIFYTVFIRCALTACRIGPAHSLIADCHGAERFAVFAIAAAFILMPRINPSAIPGFQQEQASSGVGDELDMGRFPM